VRLVILAVGRLKDGPERELLRRYLDRAKAGARAVGLTGLDHLEVDESRARQPDERKRQEAEALAARMAAGARTVLLHEGGRACTSAQWARLVSDARDRGDPALCFVIGGADGLAHDLLDRHNAVSFGAATMPHQLVRVLVAEQLYRVTTILAGHPYHRA
jgi:23S rRNA (pseudouridine1915-N3)-methyltransferase